MKSAGAVSHGLTRTASYSVWRNMKARCLNPKKWAYKWYGAKGITVCEEWKQFLNFYADMGEKPEGCELDRIDNSKGYSKENCRWVPRNINNWNRGPVRRNKHNLPRGVSAEKQNKEGVVRYRAILTHKEKKKYLGTYNTPEEAHKVYMDARFLAVEEDRRATALKQQRLKEQQNENER